MAVVLHTTVGDLPVLLYYQACPSAAFNFIALCASGYYDGCQFYRHFPGILLQTGDPTNSGKGGESIYARLPASTSEVNGSTADQGGAHSSPVADIHAAGIEASRYFRDEGFAETTHARRGVLSMAHKGTKPNTNASQFFITTAPQLSFDSVYTAFGVVDGEGVYDTELATVSSASESAKSVRSGEAVLAALEAAATEVDAKGLVANAADLRITGATVLYNPFAEGRARV